MGYAVTGDQGDDGAATRAAAADAARQLRAVLTALADPEQDLTASAATRNRMEGAVAALDQVAGYPRWERAGRPLRS